MGDPVLSIRNVSKHFDDLVAVDDVSLDIEEGEFITLLGPSGCGKTTLLRLIAGFETPTEGTISLDGEDITHVAAERRPFNMVFQSYALFPHMNVFDNVAYGLRTARLPHGEINEKVIAALETVGLVDRADVSVTALSGGQQQRVALVRALVNEPRVLLLDEPLGALDLQLRRRMQEELRALQHRVNTTFVYVTHDQEEALVMSHRVVLMRSGNAIQIGSANDVYHRPATRFVGEFVGETNMVPCELVNGADSSADVRLRGVNEVLTFPYYGEQALGVGDEALVSLRPEHLRLVPAGTGLFDGTVSDTILHGAITSHDVRVPDGTDLRVLAQDGDDPGVQDTVGVAIKPGAGVVVAAEERTVDPVLDI